MSEWTEIATASSPSGGVFDFPSLTLTGVVQLMIVCSDITVTTDATDMLLKLYVGGVLIGSTYRWGQGSILTSGTANTDGVNTTSNIELQSNDGSLVNVGNASGECFGGIIWIDNPLSTSVHKLVRYQNCHITPTPRSSGEAGACCLDNTGALEGFQLLGSSALTGGKVRVLKRV